MGAEYDGSTNEQKEDHGAITALYSEINKCPVFVFADEGPEDASFCVARKILRSRAGHLCIGPSI